MKEEKKKGREEEYDGDSVSGMENMMKKKLKKEGE